MGACIGKGKKNLKKQDFEVFYDDLNDDEDGEEIFESDPQTVEWQDELTVSGTSSQKTTIFVSEDDGF